MGRSFEKGKEVALAGPLRVGLNGQLELLHPTNVTAVLASATAGLRGIGAERGPATGLGIRPRYAPVAGVAGRVLERIVAAAVERHAQQMPDVFPPAMRARLGLPSIGEALRQIHRPDRDASPELLDALCAGRSDAHRRLAVEDLLIVQVGLARRRATVRSQPGRVCAAAAADVLGRVAAACPSH